MRDFDAIKKKEMSSIENRVRHIYNIGYETGYADGTKVNDGERGSVYYGGYGDGYNRGVNDLWESVCKFMDADIVSDKEIWGCTSWEKFAQLSPSEVIARLKEYDEKQNCIERCCKNCKHSENGMISSTERCESCYYDGVSKANTLFEPMETYNGKIEVGDEVYVPYLNEYATVIAIVSNNDGDFVRAIRCNGEPLLCKKDTVNLTGNHCDSIVDLLKRLEKRNA
jgi:hypothetical protein